MRFTRQAQGRRSVLEIQSKSRVGLEAAYLAANCQTLVVSKLMATAAKWISRLGPGVETKSIFGEVRRPGETADEMCKGSRLCGRMAKKKRWWPSEKL